MRTTMDIDVNITGINFEKDVIQEIVKQIINIKIDDNVNFEIDKKTSTNLWKFLTFLLFYSFYFFKSFYFLCCCFNKFLICNI